MKQTWIKTGAAAIVVAALGVVIWQAWPRETANAAPLAECLAGKSATMYGADWCAHCQNQKRMFGRAFSMIPYVECPENAALCKAKGIEGYPTWIFADGRRLVGEQPLQTLAETAGCPFGAPAQP